MECADYITDGVVASDEIHRRRTKGPQTLLRHVKRVLIEYIITDAGCWMQMLSCKSEQESTDPDDRESQSSRIYASNRLPPAVTPPAVCLLKARRRPPAHLP